MTKGEKFGGLKLILCIYVCHVESRWDMYLEIILYHLALYDISCMDDGCMDIMIWICLDILVSSCKIISISFVLRICADLRTLVLNVIGCIYHVFKYIRNVYDSVKFLSDVMSFISALGCSSSL